MGKCRKTKNDFSIGKRQVIMERMQLKALNASYSQYDGQTVTVAGWAKTIRDSKAFGFIELNDGSCFKNTAGEICSWD